MKHLLTFLFLTCSSLLVSAQNYVNISSPSNTPCSLGKGSVAYEYEIGTTEVTNADYCLFLNCVASAADPHKLYSMLMKQHPFGGIIRTGSEGAYAYSVKPGYENKPVVCVSWNSAIRYINWLHYNARQIEEHSTGFRPYTEGDATHGAYNTTDFGTSKAIQSCATRNKGAIYWLPNEDEWIKAAYYNPKTNAWEEDIIPEGSNCYDKQKGWKLPYPHIKDVSQGTLPSPFGTYDQQGNAAEWIENSRGEWRLAIGGSLIRSKKFATISDREGDAPDKPITAFGFRVCRKPDAKDRNSVADYSFVETQKNTSANKSLKDKNGGQYVLCDATGAKGDAQNQYRGYVGYSFYIGRYELTNEEYCNFLNAVARVADPYNLYNDNMATGLCGGIDRAKHNKTLIYKAKEGYARKPVTYLHYCDLARYANWLHYGCPNTGKSELGTTEGTETKGAYDTRDFEDVRSGKKAVYAEWGKRNVGAKYWIPSENEWYKAAYYDPTITGNRKYHDYPTRSSDAPTQQQANYMIDDCILDTATFVVDVERFDNAASYFGTQQQGGNVWEWTEDWQYGTVGVRGLRGGSWGYTAYGLNAINMDPGGLDDFLNVYGGRLCKAIDENGWQPVEKPWKDKLTEWWAMLSPNKIIVITCLFLLGIVSIVVLIILFLFNTLRHGHKKTA